MDTTRREVRLANPLGREQRVRQILVEVDQAPWRHPRRGLLARDRRSRGAASADQRKNDES
jgi:hypothetical protein